MKKSREKGIVLAHSADPNAVKLNNVAVRFIARASLSRNSLREALYDSALFYLDKAIDIDSVYLLAYTNKSQVLLRKNLPEQSLQVLNKVQMIKPEFAEVILGQGFILEKMGKENLADEKYRQALEAYEKRVKEHPENLKAKADIAFLYIFLEDTDKARNEIQKLIIANPGNTDLMTMEGLINDFDKLKFLNEY